MASFSSHELYIKAFIDVIETTLVLIYFVQSTVYCIKPETNYVSDKTGLYIDLDKPVLAMLTLCMFLYLFFFPGILSYFNSLVKEDPSLSVAVAAIKTLLHFLENNKSKSNVKR